METLVKQINGTKKTELRVELKLITPEVAKNLLRYNVKNRTMSISNVTFLSNQIKKGSFLENGEAIIFDSNGELKDGQHRLKAISINKESFYIPVVTGVKPIAMATYDTGKNRSAADILKLNGFKYSSLIATFVQSLNKFQFNKGKSNNLTRGNRKSSLTNQEVLDYVSQNYDWIVNIISNTDSIYDKMKPKVLTSTNISLISYLIGGKNPSSEVFTFMKHLTGVLKTESSAPLYMYNKMYNAKVNKEPLNAYWVLGMSIKAWNYYSEGNPSVNYFKFQNDSELPKPNKTFLS